MMFLWEQQWKELEVLLSPQNRESLQHRGTVAGALPSSQGCYIKLRIEGTGESDKAKIDTWFRIYREELGKKQEL